MAVLASLESPAIRFQVEEARVTMNEDTAMPSGSVMEPGGLRPRISLLAAVMFGFPLIQYLFLQVGTAFQGGRETTEADWFVFFVWIVALEWTLFLLVRWGLRREGRSLAEVGVPALTRRDVVGVGAVVAGLAGFILVVGDSSSEAVQNLPDIFPKTLEQKLVFLPVALTAGICEETLFRGFCYTELRRLGLGLIAAVLLPTISFVLIHGGINQDLGLMLFRVVVSLAFAALYIWRGSLRAPILLHAATDAVLVLTL